MSSAVDNLADNLASASVQDPNGTANDTVLASAAEGRRLYIGNLASATTEGELKEFFSAYKVCVRSSPSYESCLSSFAVKSQLLSSNSSLAYMHLPLNIS